MVLGQQQLDATIVGDKGQPLQGILGIQRHIDAAGLEDAQQPHHHLYGTLQAHHSPGGIVDVAIQIDRRGAAHEAPVKLIGIGLPDSMVNQTTTIPGGRSTGYLSYVTQQKIQRG